MSVTTLFLDMNAYFASVEQQVRPELRNLPVAIAAVDCDTTCCIAVSHQARHFGIKTGTQVRRAKHLCPGLRIVEARPKLYIRFHHAIVAAVESCLHVDSVYSIDEMACGLIGPEQRPGCAIQLAQQVKQALRQQVGDVLKCSIGLAPNRFLAKVAATMQKVDGLVVITPRDLPHKLYGLKLADLPGIGPRMLNRLNRCGIRTVRRLCQLSAQDLRDIWHSVLGQQWWYWLRGHNWQDPPTHRRTVGHSRVLPPHLRNEAGAKAVLVQLLHKAAARLRHLGYGALYLTIKVSFMDGTRWKERAALGLCRDTLTMLQALDVLWHQLPSSGKRKIRASRFKEDGPPGL